MKTLANLLGMAATTILAGCMSTTPQWDARFGEAARTTAAQQVIDPNASRNTDPVSGIDGKAASALMDEYARSYTRPEGQSNVFTIDLGTGTGR